MTKCLNIFFALNPKGEVCDVALSYTSAWSRIVKMSPEGFKTYEAYKATFEAEQAARIADGWTVGRVETEMPEWERRAATDE